MYPYQGGFGRPQQPSFQQNPITGQLPSFGQLPIQPPQIPGMGQQQVPGQMGGGQQMSPMGGQQPSGTFPPMGQPSPYGGQRFMQSPYAQQGQHQGFGQFAPLFGISGMLAQHGRLGSIAPLIGGFGGLAAKHFGLFK